MMKAWLPKIFSFLIPVVCLKETSDELACKICLRKIHTFCGYASKGDEVNILCNICFKTENAIESNINSKINLEIQDEKNENEFGKKNSHCFLRSYCALTDIDMGRGDSCNILTATMSVTEDSFYRLETSERILKQVYVRS